jgi:hypothetical protein
MEPYLPYDTVYRTKMGFSVPLADCFRNGIRDYARAYIVEKEDPFLSTATSFRKTTTSSFGRLTGFGEPPDFFIPYLFPCVTVCVCPETPMVPVRRALLFAATI